MLTPARLTSVACLLAGLAAPAAAQVAGVPPQPGVAPGPQNPTIERIRVEDRATRIDELRVGGQTQSISVQPKNDMPAYEIRPADAQGSPGAGARVWTFRKF